MPAHCSGYFFAQNYIELYHGWFIDIAAGYGY